MEQHGLFSSKLNQTLGSIALFMLIVALGAYANLTWSESKYAGGDYPANISVQGEGEVLAVPDVGQFSFTVNAEGDKASDVQAEVEESVSDILTFLAEKGIEEKDIKNLYYNQSPRWRFEDTICPLGSFCPREQVQDGFEVSQSIQVKVRDTEQAGDIIAGVGERGATNISNLNFTIDDTDALQAEARAKAIDDAQAKAEQLAADLGVRLVRIVGFSEGGGYYEPYYAERSMMSFDAAEDGFGGASLPMGENSTNVTVNITYEVR